VRRRAASAAPEPESVRHMSAALQPMSVEEFLAWEERQELRYEFDGVIAYGMTGGTAAHAAIQVNLISALQNRLKGKPCRAFGSELKLKLGSSVRYPDAFVVCTPVEPTATYVAEPVVIFEVLSESTARADLGVKNTEYQATPSARRYVVLHQTAIAAEVFYRDDLGDWKHRFLSGDQTLALPEIDVEIPLSEIYDDIALPS
jgi:Uma2 family endonuclease